MARLHDHPVDSSAANGDASAVRAGHTQAPHAGHAAGAWLLDGLSIGASLACLVHCLVLPLAILLLPTLAAFLALPEAFHLWALAFAVPTSIIAMALGYRRHRRHRPWQLGAAGLALLAAGALLMPSEMAETALTVAGALLLSFGHVLNWRAAPHG